MDHQATKQATRRPNVVGVFDDHHQAEKAMSELLAAGFTSREIGFAMRGDESHLRSTKRPKRTGKRR
jgi:hypothetical protein